MKIGIIGIGVVGSAILKSFNNHKDIITYSYDKYKNIGTIDELYYCEIIFLSLPTPFSYELKEYDKSAINDVCEKLNEIKYKGIIVIKSTVEPQTTEKLAKKYEDLYFCHNPEFLSANSAYDDFEKQKHIVIGIPTIYADKKMFLPEFYKKYYPSAEISICSSTESELMKISINSFYAVKVQFFNEIYLLCEKHTDANFNKVRDLMLKNGWINPMHTSVPGTDGKLSYGGMCFPKDTNALLEHMKIMDCPHKVLESVIEERNILRND